MKKLHRPVRTRPVVRLSGMAHKPTTRNADGSSVSLCPETNTISVMGPLSSSALFMAQAMCAPNDVLAIVSILDRPENYVLGYVDKAHVVSFLSKQEQLAIAKRWTVAITVYEGPEMVVSGTFDGRQYVPSDAN